MIILDTSFIIATLIPKDDFHKLSVEAIDKSDINNGEVFIINNFVVSELVTLSNLKFKLYKDIIMQYIFDLLNKKVPNSLYSFLDEIDYNLAMEFAKYHNLSFTDCAVIASACKYKEAQILSHDQELLKIYSDIKNYKSKSSHLLMNDKSKRRYKANSRGK